MCDRLTITIIAASYGDSLLLQSRGAKDVVVLIDGGPLQALPAVRNALDAALLNGPWLDLLVLTHVDADHIEGLVRLLGEKPCRVAPREIWFNGWRQVDEHRYLSSQQGEFFGALVSRRFPEGLNRSWDGRSIVVSDSGPLPTRWFKERLKLTVLSPTTEKLSLMRNSWAAELAKRNLAPGDVDAAWKRLLESRRLQPRGGEFLSETGAAAQLVEERFLEDDAPANGASIAFLAEDRRNGASCLFLADAHNDVIVSSIKRLIEERHLGRLSIDAIKLAHHGSRFNFSREMLDLIHTPRFIVSTDGTRFGHPDPEVIEAVIAHSTWRPPTFYFNYLGPTTRRWADEDDQRRRDYRAVYGDAAGLQLDLP